MPATVRRNAMVSILLGKAHLIQNPCISGGMRSLSESSRYSLSTCSRSSLAATLDNPLLCCFKAGIHFVQGSVQLRMVKFFA